MISYRLVIATRTIVSMVAQTITATTRRSVVGQSRTCRDPRLQTVVVAYVRSFVAAAIWICKVQSVLRVDAVIAGCSTFTGS
jgi:hypothetical protein